jgi:DNA ligase-1
MLFKEVCTTFDTIATISSRTEITTHLAELFKKAKPHEAQIISYLAQGLLRPPYLESQFGMASKSIAKVLAGLFETEQSEITRKAHELGDLGLVAAQGTWHPEHHLTVEQVYQRLCEIEETTGAGSQDLKAQLLFKLLRDVEPACANIIIKMIVGALRLGFSDMTIIDALSWMIKGDKSLHAEIENAYNVCADLGTIAAKLVEHGEAGLKQIDITLGVPIRPAAAERLPSAQDIIKKLGPCVAQPKLDGFRLQIHVKHEGKKRMMRFFSRNLIDMSSMFPDLIHAFEQYDIKDLIVEGEAIVYDPKTEAFLPFQETVKRKRKHGIDAMATELPLRLFLFDILYYDGQSQLKKSEAERRTLLLKLFSSEHEKSISVIDERPMHNAQELEDYFDECMTAGLEGLVVKRPDAAYQPGKRNFNWIKLKSSEETALEDTIDTVILGYYLGTGKRAHFGIGAFLVGVYDKKNDRYETVAKVGTGLTDEGWRELKKKCDEKKTHEQPHNVVCAKELYPAVWVYPEIVCSVRADEITLSPLHTAGKTAHHEGLALRFPRFIEYRIDKSAREATTEAELKEMFEHQRKQK